MKVVPGTFNREPQECSRNILEYKDPGKCVPTKFLLHSWGSMFGFPVKSLSSSGQLPAAWMPSGLGNSMMQGWGAFKDSGSAGLGIKTAKL